MTDVWVVGGFTLAGGALAQAGNLLQAHMSARRDRSAREAEIALSDELRWLDDRRTAFASFLECATRWQTLESQAFGAALDLRWPDQPVIKSVEPSKAAIDEATSAADAALATLDLVGGEGSRQAAAVWMKALDESWRARNLYNRYRDGGAPQDELNKILEEKWVEHLNGKGRKRFVAHARQELRTDPSEPSLTDDATT